MGTAAPLVRVVRSAAPVAGRGLQLTRRGLVVVMALFLTTVAAATITAVGAFLSVSNSPVDAGQGSAIGVARG
ncbi:hypothetical protein [Micropruina sp.]|uniref:hypothetical protein n=1 Tax=Micropruina sp. TaxID=2737536 RepID=UPI0039E2FC03